MSTRASSRPAPERAASAGRRRRSAHPAPIACPLCGGTARAYHAERRRPYMRCPQCKLISVPAAWHLEPAAEKAVYDRHDNRPDHAGYRRFLSRPLAVVTARVDPPASGLDFGAGPGPTLSRMLAEAGFDMALYDPFYAPDRTVFERRYDFITATEVFEHLADPAGEIARLCACLAPGGWLVVMTKRHRDDVDAFARWHYTHDPTHVRFYAVATFDWIARHFGLQLTVADRDIVALRKPPRAGA